MHSVIPADSRIKEKDNENLDIYLKFKKKSEKIVEHKRDSHTNCYRSARNNKVSRERAGAIKTTAMLKPAKILRRELDNKGVCLLSFEIQ